VVRLILLFAIVVDVIPQQPLRQFVW